MLMIRLSRTRSDGREHAVQHRHAHRCHQPTAEPLNDPEDHQLLHRRRESARGGGHGEQGDSGQEHLACAPPIAQPAGHRNRDRDGDEEPDVDGGGELDRHSEVGSDGGQRDVDDGRVDDRDEHRRHENRCYRSLRADPRHHRESRGGSALLPR
jgi:hypothetical protein